MKSSILLKRRNNVEEKIASSSKLIMKIMMPVRYWIQMKKETKKRRELWMLNFNTKKNWLPSRKKRRKKLLSSKMSKGETRRRCKHCI